MTTTGICTGGDIDVGHQCPAIGSDLSSDNTWVSKSNSANATGTIDCVSLRMRGDVQGIQAGVFTDEGSNVLTCTASPAHHVTLDDIGASMGEDCYQWNAPGDFTAFNVTSGEYAGENGYANQGADAVMGYSGAAVGLWFRAGDQLPCSSQTFSLNGSNDMDLYFTGTAEPPETTAPPTTLAPTTLPPTTLAPTTLPTTAAPTTLPPTTLAPTTLPTTAAPTTIAPTTLPPTSLAPTTLPTTSPPTTLEPTTPPPTTLAPTTLEPTEPPTTLAPTTLPTTAAPTSLAPTTLPTTVVPTTVAPTTVATTAAPTTTLTTLAPTTLAPTTIAPTIAPTTAAVVEACIVDLKSSIARQLNLESPIVQQLSLKSPIAKYLNLEPTICRGTA